MTDFQDAPGFEDDLRRSMVAVEATARPRPDFEARLLAIADAPAVRPHRVWVRPVRLLPPLLAAAAVIAVVAGGTALVSSTQSQRPVRPATPGPTLSASPAPSASPSAAPSAAPSPTDRSSAPAKPVRAAVPSGFTAFDASFVDQDHGWALGNYDCVTGRCAVVLSTRDGGAHWTRLAAPEGVTPVDDEGSPSGGSCGDNGTVFGPCVDHILFADRRHGYTWSFHSLYATDDGGVTWTDQSGRALDLVVAGGYAYRLSPVHDCSAGCTGHLQASAVGSNSWRTVDPDGVAPLLFTSQLSASGSDVYFLRGVDGASVTHLTLYRTDDGGSSWNVVGTDLCGDPRLNTPSVSAGGGELALVCRTTAASGSSESLLLSPDRGHSIGDTRPLPGISTRAAPALTVLSASTLVWEVVGQRATVYASRDGGVTWRPVDSAADLRPIHALSTTTAYRLRADGTGVVWTTDGGTTWTSRYFR